MDLTQILTLSLLQGLTEFLPISSSAHLILVPVLTGWPDQGLAFDVAVHVGTLVAVVTYFHRPLAIMTRSWCRSVTGRGTDAEARLAWALIAATVPVGLAGLALKGIVETELRSPLVIATTTLVFAFALWWADARRRGERSEHELGFRDILIIGLAQALSLIPGVSRSGITLTAALAVGMDRQSAARFVFLLAIPIITLAGGLLTVDLVRSQEPVNWSDLVLGAGVAAASAMACIHLFLGFIARIGVLPFVIYRLVLAAILFAYFA